VAAIAAIALVGAGVLLGRPGEAERAQFAAASAVAGPPPKSIAVLPLVNIGRDSTDAYFATGMTDEITSALARIPGLRVASRTAAGALQRTDGVEAIGKALNVATLLEGTEAVSGSPLGS
jgi:serine/threonine-protein kinase